MKRQGDTADADYWSCYPYDDYLRFDNIVEAIEDRISEGAPEDPIPEVVTVYGFKRRAISPHRVKVHAVGILRDLLEALDDEYGSAEPDQSTTGSLQDQADAEEFVAKIVGRYHVHLCDQVSEMTVEVSDYLDKEELEALYGTPE